MSDEKKYDSDFIDGIWVNEPEFNENGEFQRMKISISEDALTELTKYLVGKEGKVKRAYLTAFLSRSGKPCCTVFNANSEAAKEHRAKVASESEQGGGSDLPF